MVFRNPSPSENLSKLQEAYDKANEDGEPERTNRIKQRINRYKYGNKDW